MAQDPTDLDATRLAHAERAKRERKMRARERDDLRRLMSSEHGRRFVHGVVERAGVFRLSLNPNATENTHATAFAEGRRNEGLRVLGLISEACPEQWATAQKEAKELESHDDIAD